MKIFFGIDGCHAGWIVVSCDSDLCFKSCWVKSIQETIDYIRGATLTLIDIPIGLKDGKQPGNFGRRACDVKAREILGKRAFSVFPAPQREALKAETWEEANSINKKICGRGLSKQTGGIMKKIAGVDFILISDMSLQSRLRETHPEVCFWSLNNRQIMKHPKKPEQGLDERLGVLARLSQNANEFYKRIRSQHKVKDVRSDDIVDAMAAALTASLSDRYGIQTLPQTPEIDSHGLRMEIVFTNFEELE
jgi:predicted RNase H-like nuclease